MGPALIPFAELDCIFRADRFGRGPSGYDAQLRWNAVLRDDLAGYKVYWRKTSAP